MAHPRTPQRTSSSVAEERPRGDPWHAVGSITAGVGLYGVLGWGFDRVLGTTGLVAVGIVLGAVLGLYAVWQRFMRPLSVEHQGPRMPLTPTAIPTKTSQEDR